MLRLAGISGALSDAAVAFFLKGMSGLRTDKGWRKYPFFYTLLALTSLMDDSVVGELRHVAAECERRLKRLKPDSDVVAARRAAVLERVLARV